MQFYANNLFDCLLQLREHQQKTFVTHTGFWPLMGLGGRGVWVNSLKKFTNNTAWSSKNLWKMISTDVKANKNNKK